MSWRPDLQTLQSLACPWRVTILVPSAVADGRDPVALLWPGPRCSYVALGLL